MHLFSIIFCIVVSACQSSVFYSNYSCPCQFTKPREKSIAYSLHCLVPRVLILDYYFLLPPNIMAYENLMISLCKFDRGLGKTIQTIAFLTVVLWKEPESDDFIGGGSDGKKNQKLIETKKLVLIICPTSVIHNWENEFHEWGTFNIAIYHGPNRDLVLEKLEIADTKIVLEGATQVFGPEL